MTLSRDGISGLVCLIVSLGMLALTWGLPPAVMVPIGPAFYPRVVVLTMAVLSAILLVLDIRAARQRAASPPVAAEPTNYRLVLATFIEFGLYIALLPAIGFRIATVLFVAALQVTLEWPASNRRWVLVVLIAIATSWVSYIVFEDYLSVLLPRGIWSGM
jgi:hypothetical protein